METFEGLGWSLGDKDVDDRDQRDPTGSAGGARETTVVVQVDEHASALRKAWESYGGGYYGGHLTGKVTERLCPWKRVVKGKTANYMRSHLKLHVADHPQ